MQMLKLISSFISPPGRVNVTERDISESDISVSKCFQEGYSSLLDSRSLVPSQ